MTRYEDHRAKFLFATVNSEPDSRFRELKQMQKSVKPEFFADLIYFLSRFEADNDITPDDARRLMMTIIKEETEADKAQRISNMF